MEHDDLDDLFRDRILNDETELNEQELHSKKNIWEALETLKQQRIFPIWKVAAAVLLLLLGGSGWFFSKKINQQQQDFVALEKRYNNIKTSLDIVQAELNYRPKNIAEQNVNILPKEKKQEIHVISQKEFVDRIVYVSDTVFVSQNISPNEKIKLVRDTIFIEVPVKVPSKMVELELPNEESGENIKKKTKKKPSKVEFVFDKKKALERPQKDQNFIIINEIELAKKNEKKKRSLILFPIKN